MNNLTFNQIGEKYKYKTKDSDFGKQQFIYQSDSVSEMPEMYFIIVGNDIYYPTNYVYREQEQNYVRGDSFYALSNSFKKKIKKLLNINFFNYHFSKVNNKYITGFSFILDYRVISYYDFIDSNGTISKHVNNYGHVFKKNLNISTSYFKEGEPSTSIDNFTLIDNNIPNLTSNVLIGVDELLHTHHNMAFQSSLNPVALTYSSIDIYVQSNIYKEGYYSLLYYMHAPMLNNRFIGRPLSIYSEDLLNEKGFLPLFQVVPLFQREIKSLANYILPDIAIIPTLIGVIVTIGKIEDYVHMLDNLNLLINSNYDAYSTSHINLYSCASSNFTEFVVSDILANLLYFCPANKLVVGNYEEKLGWFFYFFKGSAEQKYSEHTATKYPISKVQQNYPDEYLFFDFPVYTKLCIRDKNDWNGVIGFCNFELDSDKISNFPKNKLLNRISTFITEEMETEYAINYDNLYPVSAFDDINEDEVITFNLPEHKMYMMTSISKPIVTTALEKFINKYNSNDIENSVNISFLVSFIEYDMNNDIFIEYITTKYQHTFNWNLQLPGFLHEDAANYSRNRYIPLLMRVNKPYTVKIYKVDYRVDFDIVYEPNTKLKLGCARYPFIKVGNNTEEIINNYNITFQYENLSLIHSEYISNGFLVYTKVIGDENDFWFYAGNKIYNVKDGIKTEYIANENTFKNISGAKVIRLILNFEDFIKSNVFNKYFIEL